MAKELAIHTVDVQAAGQARMNILASALAGTPLTLKPRVPIIGENWLTINAEFSAKNSREWQRNLWRNTGSAMILLLLT